jgi:hypothetical protein
VFSLRSQRFVWSQSSENSAPYFKVFYLSELKITPGHLNSGIVGSNPAQDMDVYRRLFLCCAVLCT